MANAKHTPGPWKVDKMDNGYGFQIINEKGNRVIGSIASNGAGIMGQSAQAKANAKFIAAAPDMAEALQKMLTAFGGGNRSDDACNAARAALVKAGIQ